MTKKYRNETTNINGSGQVTADNCNCITFYNPPTNSNVFFVNNMPVAVGCIFALEGHAGEIDTSIYDIKVLVKTEQYFVIKKFYTS